MCVVWATSSRVFVMGAQVVTCIVLNLELSQDPKFILKEVNRCLFLMRHYELWISCMLTMAHPWDLSQFSRLLNLGRWHGTGVGRGVGNGGRVSTRFQLGLALDLQSLSTLSHQRSPGAPSWTRTHGEPWAVVRRIDSHPTFHTQARSRPPTSVMREPDLTLGLCWLFSPRKTRKPPCAKHRESGLP